MTCGYAGCLFKDPVRDAQLPVTQGSSGASDGAEEGTSHIGLHLAEEAHPYGTSQSHLHVAACDIVHGPSFAPRATTSCTIHVLIMCFNARHTVRMCRVPGSMRWTRS